MNEFTKLEQMEADKIAAGYGVDSVTQTIVLHFLPSQKLRFKYIALREGKALKYLLQEHCLELLKGDENETK